MEYTWRDCCIVCGSPPGVSCDYICQEIREEVDIDESSSLSIAEQDANEIFAARQAEVMTEIDIELDRWYPLDFVYSAQ